VLSGVSVVSFTHFLQGPSATQILADLGADVIKVEPTGGAFERGWSGPDAYLDGESVFFLLGNRNARSLSIDLKAPESIELLRKLLAEADVLIESFRPGTMERLGLGYESLKELNPRLVYCSLSGYGSDGPYKDRPGQDVLIQSLSGLAHATGGGDAPPTPVGASVVDQHGAVLGALGILAALHGRERTGRGCLVESNLLSAALDLQIEPLAYYLNEFRGERSPSRISSMYYKAPYGVFPTADGHICVSITAPPVLAAVLDDPWFATVGDDEVLARREEINERVTGHLARRTTKEWEDLFTERKVWFAPVNDYAAVVDDPQVRHNESVLRFEHPDAGEVAVLGHPVRYDGERPGLRTFPPALGAHTRDVLAGLDLTAEQIDALVARGVVRE
jgi:crotonobetainyl-CoA:carnitine CoA-transferase CaiB-like acyl-CoA transferase